MLYSEFKLENIYPEVNFCGKNVCGTCYFVKACFCGSLKKLPKIRTRKNFISHGIHTCITLFLPVLILTKQHAGMLGWPLKLLNCRRSKVCLTRSMPLCPNGCIFLAFYAPSISDFLAAIPQGCGLVRTLV